MGGCGVCQLTAAAFVMGALHFNVTKELQQVLVRWRANQPAFACIVDRIVTT